MSPGAWLEQLEPRLAAQQREIQVYENYYDGKHPLAFATQKFREAFGSLFGAFADNWCEIVVDAAVERLSVEGFRFGAEEDADDDAWAIWQANCLDAESELAHTEAVKCGRAFALVAPPDDGVPVITVEHPSEVIVAHAPGNRRLRRAALKKWLDDSGYVLATLYLPDQIVKFQSQRKLGKLDSTARIDWTRRSDDPGGNNPLDVVPMVPLYNRPTMLGGGQSDLKSAIPLQNAINKELLDMVVASEFAAFPQRVLTGVETDTDPVTGEPRVGGMSARTGAVSRIWAFANEQAKWGEFQAADLENYVKAIGMLVQHFSAQTRTPPHYLLGSIVNASGDALKAAETGLVKRCERKHTWFGEGWEETLRLAFKARGKPGDEAKASATDAETIWKDPETRSDAELGDFLVKLRSVGLPLEKLWEMGGFSPQEIERMKTLAGLPDRPPPGASTAQVPPVLPDASANGGQPTPAATAGQ